jgi:hypothetical protein
VSQLAIKRIREAIESEYPPGTVSVRTVDARAALAALEADQRALEAQQASTQAVTARNNGRGARESTPLCRTCSRLAGLASGCVAKHGPDGRGD